MRGKSIGLVILWWSEVIISLRVLLFTVPVIISNVSGGNLAGPDKESGIIFLLTLTAVFYLFCGLASIAGFKFWKWLHFAAVMLTGLLTLNALKGTGRAADGLYFYYPVVFAVIITGLAVMLDKGKAPASAG